jgi:hypothetical protein
MYELWLYRCSSFLSNLSNSGDGRIVQFNSLRWRLFESLNKDGTVLTSFLTAIALTGYLCRRATAW